jgi:hypothetical protein
MGQNVHQFHLSIKSTKIKKPVSCDFHITSCLNGQKKAGFCSFLANFSQLFYCRLAKR